MSTATPPRQTRARRALIAILLLCGGLLGGCDAPRQEAPPPQAPALRLGVSTSILAAPVRIAVARDLLAAHGLDAEVTFYSSGKAALADLLAGRIDVSTTADAPIMRAGMEDADLVVLATFIYSNAHGKILARRSRGIETVPDLSGKRMGRTAATTADFFQQVFLIQAGIDLDTVETVDIPTDRLLEALQAGQVDAIATWEPQVHRGASLLGEDAVVFSTTEGLRQTFNLVTRPALVEQRPEDLRRLLRAVADAVAYANRQPAQAQVLVAESLGLPLELVEDTWDDYVFKLFLDQGLLLTLEAEARWYLRDSGAPEQPLPDFLRFIDPSLLRQVAPGSVTLIH